MTSLIRHLTQQEQLNFLLTNRIPRRLLTQYMGWYSKLKNPWLTRFSIAVWKLFASDLNLNEAQQQHFNSLHDCFIRQLKPGSRPVDMTEDIITSPSDAIVGACGNIEGQSVFQAKGYPYELSDLIPDNNLCKKLSNGIFVTLRLKSSMYHRFHAPQDCSVSDITYISGDTWNVNPIALKRIEKLYCKNERAVIELHTGKQDDCMVMVPVAAILVASMKFHCLNETLDLKYQGPNHLNCNASYRKGEEMGYFQHGSTIIVFASSNYQLLDHIQTDTPILMGQPLLRKRASISEKKHFIT
jgi:phosphatidylserine decarboxylase